MDKAIVVFSMEVHNLLLIEFTHLSVRTTRTFKA